MTTVPTARYPDEAHIPWVDTAKGVCIILVVMMHATLGVGEAMGGTGFMHEVVAFAKPFRMPDFFLVSGLFLARVIDRDWRTYGDKRIVHFLYFYFLWLLIQSGLKYGQVSGGHPLGFLEHLAFSLVEPYSSLWFIYLLAVFSVVTKWLRGVPPLLLLALGAALEIAPIHTGWFLLNEFCDRWVYFLGGYLLAPRIFRFAAAAAARPAATLAGLALWALVNGAAAFAPAGVEGYETVAALPFASLALGVLGAAAIIAVSALVAGTKADAPLAYCGRHSIAIYLAFFLPMAATRAVLIKTGVVTDVGLVSFLVTAAAVGLPLVLERIVRRTPASFLFRRPAAFHLKPRPAVRLQAAE
jgi:uncharacterized membrane protein YcfT